MPALNGFVWVGAELFSFKKSLFLFLLAALSFGVFAQAQSVPSQISEDTIILSTDSFGDAGDGSVQFNSGKKKSSVWPFVKMILILAVLCAAVYGVLYFVKRNVNKTKDEDEFLRRVAFLNLAPGKSVEIVTYLDEHAYILGVTESGINLIGEITDKDRISAMNLNADKNQNSQKARNFSEILDMFLPGGKNTNRNVFSGSEKNIEDVLSSQRSRLNKKE